MSRLALSALAALLLFTTAGCQRRHHPNPAATIEEEGELASTISVAEPRDASQVLNGFHGIEQGAWRWTRKEFSVSLAPPAGARARGARLQLFYVIPDVVKDALLGANVRASVGGVDSGSCRIDKPGEHSCTFDVPPAALEGEAVIAKFAVDKAYGPTPQDTRELALIVYKIGLEAK